MSLNLVGELGRPLSVEELDGNQVYLESLSKDASNINSGILATTFGGTGRNDG